MAYVRKITKVPDEYQGESFTKSLSKTSGSEWAANEEANYEMVGKDGIVVSSGNLVKSGDNLSITFTVPKADTATLKGKYDILVHQTDTNNADVDDIIAIYKMNYLERKAT